MISLLYTINYINQGGPSRVLLNLIESIDKRKYRITVLTLLHQNDNEIIKYLEKMGISIVSMDINKSILSLLAVSKKIFYIIKEINPDIIHTHGVVTTILLAWIKKHKKVTTVHNCIFEDYMYTYGKIKGNIIARLHLAALKRFDKVICCSKTSFDVICHRLDNITYIRNGSKMPLMSCPDRAKIRTELGISRQAVMYIYVGVLTQRKNILELIKLFENNRTREEYLVILGEGPLRSECEKRESEYIKILGFKKDVGSYLNAADIYISNSLSEGFPISVVEALGCGLCCLLSDIPAHRECTEIDSMYYIGELFDNENFAEKKQQIVQKVKTAGKAEVQSFYNNYLSVDVMVREYEKQYEEVVDEF